MYKREENGKVRFCEKYKDELTGKWKVASVTMPKDTAHYRKEASIFLQNRIREATSEKTTNYTLGALIDEYRSAQKLTVKASTWGRNYHTGESLKRILGADTLINKMTVKFVRDRFLSTRRSPGTLNEWLSRFKAILRWAYSNQLISTNDLERRLQRFNDVPHRQKIEDKFLEVDQANFLLIKMQQNQWRLLTKFLLLSGLRYGEAAALEEADIDLNRKFIKITKQYDSNNRIVTTPKTGNSYGYIDMQPELEACVREILHYGKTIQIGLGIRSRLLFFDDNGEHIHYAAYSKYFREITEKLFGRRLTPHSLRHTHASMLFQQGYTVEEVSRRLRNTSKVAKDIYIHYTEKLKEKDRDKIMKIRLLQ